jgi:hypothetical protein
VLGVLKSPRLANVGIGGRVSAQPDNATLDEYQPSGLTIKNADESFISDVAEDEIDQAVASAVISLGQKLNMRVIAEGVETDYQTASKNNCDEMRRLSFQQTGLRTGASRICSTRPSIRCKFLGVTPNHNRYM